MNKYKLQKSIWIGIALVLLIAASIYQHFASNQDTLDVLRQGELAAAAYENLPGGANTFKLFDAGQALLGYGVISSASGYGGKITVLSIVDVGGILQKAVIIAHNETPLYLNKVQNAGLLEKISGRSIAQGYADIDAVSGATVTTRGIVKAVQKGTGQLGNEQFGLNIPLENTINLGWQDFVALALMVLAFAGSALKLKKLRSWVLLVSVIFIGFVLNASLTYSNYVNLISGNLPNFLERPVWYLMVPGILLVTVLWGKNVYCSWLCPFGAVQEGIFRGLNLWTFTPSQKIQSMSRSYRWPILWFVAMITLIGNHPGAASYEPFSVFFDGRGNWAQWAIMGIVVIMSITLLRFWCRNFCPVGTILDYATQLKHRLVGLQIGKNEVINQVPMRTAEQAGCSEHQPCESCSKAKRTKMTAQDKGYILIVSAINILIIISLLMNFRL